MSRPFYQVTERKKAELDALQVQVQNAESVVAKLQIVVDAFIKKNNELAAYLATTEKHEETALTNQKLVHHVVNDVNTLMQTAQLAQQQTRAAQESIHHVAEHMAVIVDQLIIASDVINKLADLINQKKALNPLISDVLVARVAEAGKDANSAIALTLTAVEACYAADSSGQESEALTDLEVEQITQLYIALIEDHLPEKSIQTWLEQIYTTAKATVQKALTAKAVATQQLNQAQADLDAATIHLNSLKLGLKAADAAAKAA